MLNRALEKVCNQVTNGLFLFEIVIVDNDSQRSAEKVVINCKHSHLKEIQIAYECEPEKNIAKARNRAINIANGNYIAFIDDDEFPIGSWLIKLYELVKSNQVDGVLGPVLPDFPGNAPDWIKKCDIFDRRRLPTGTILTNRDTRTGNVLLNRQCISGEREIFDIEFGLTGGEDVDFFERKMRSGRKFIWCDEAIVYETVPEERWSIDFHFKKNFRIGTLNGERLRKNGFLGIIGIFKTLCGIPIRLCLLLFNLPTGKQNWINPLLKLAYSAGCVLAYLGFSALRYRQ